MASPILFLYTLLSMKYPIKHIQTGNNNPILRSPSEEIQSFSPELVEFCHKLLVLMRQNK